MKATPPPFTRPPGKHPGWGDRGIRGAPLPRRTHRSLCAMLHSTRLSWKPAGDGEPGGGGPGCDTPPYTPPSQHSWDLQMRR